MATEYKVGQVWERNGLQREIVKIVLSDQWNQPETKPLNRVHASTVFHIQWKRPSGSARLAKTWCTTWNVWADKATLVKESDNG